jgi:ceramide glucosyltransferase
VALNILEIFLVTTTLLALLILMCTFVLTKYFFARKNPNTASDFTPPVSILKALNGLDDGLEQNLISFCDQDYPEYEVIFCIEDESDPAVSVVKRVISESEHSRCQLKLIVPCPRTGMNPKISNLKYGYEAARYDVIVYNDSEVRVAPDYLRKVVAPLADPKVGAVTGLPVYVHAQNWVAGLEALTLNANVFGLLISPFLLGKLDAVIGATVALRRQVLEECQLFEVAKDHVADDGIIGQRIDKQGYRIHLVKYIVPMIQHRERFQNFFRRNVRWSRAIRIIKTKSYFIFGSLMGSLYAFIYLLLNPASVFAIALFSTIILLRVIQIVHHNFVYVKDNSSWRYLWLVPIRDVFISPMFWFMGCFGNSVWWRGVKYRIRKDGNMTKINA